MPYRFVHAADIHLDSPLRSLAFRDPALAELIGTATRRAFVAIVDLCLDERVDALILSGDLYDGDQTSMKTARFLAAELHRLHQANIRIFVIRGNHDALSKITKELAVPETTRIFGGRADCVAVTSSSGGLSVAIHGLSFTHPHAPDSLLPKYKPPVEDAVNIGLMHTSLGGSPGHDAYAPCGLAELDASGFSYWALGHIHKRSVAAGRCTVVMPGMPQGRDIGESGPKSVALVTVLDDRSICIEERLTSVAQFERVAVDVAGAATWPDVVAAIAAALERCRETVASEHLVARLVLSGATPQAWRIRNDADLLKTQAEETAARLGRTWIDKLEIGVTGADTRQGPQAGALAELRRSILNDVQRSDAYRAAMIGIMEELRPQLPPECRHVVGNDAAALDAALAVLAERGSEDVLARLQAPDAVAA